MKTKKIKIVASLACSLLGAGVAMGDNVAQWDFTSGDLNATLGGNPLQYLDGAGGATAAQTLFGSTATLGLPAINGTNANVMAFPASGSSMGFTMPNPATANGGGTLVNNYTLILDVLIPTNSVSRVCPIIKTDGGYYGPNADLVMDSSGGIGAPPGPYYGSIQPNTWYRVGFVVSTTEIDEYINGVKVGVQAITDPTPDSRYALNPGDVSELFQNSTTNGAAPGYVSSIQIRDTALNAGQMAALGAATAAKIPAVIPSIPSYLEAQSPAPNQGNVTPLPPISATLNPGSTTIDSGSISLSLDGTPLATTVNYTGSNYVLSASTPSLLLPYSTHTAGVVFSDSVAGAQSKTWTFTVCNFQNVNLPAPVYLETFDELAEGGIPDGWTATNNTDTGTIGLALDDTQSDSYKNWVAINTAHYASVYGDTDNYVSPGFPRVSGNRREMIPPIVENGVLLTNLASGNLLVAESDQRSDSQVQVIFTKDYNFAGITNVYASFHHMNEQNQDNVCSVEYSVDQGVTWQPLLYLLDDGTTDSDGSDIVYYPGTKNIDVFSTFQTARRDQAHGEAYGDFIGAVVSTNLIPFIRPCRNDDPVQQKRIELFRLPLADNQTNVRLRFMQAGTGSWFFDIDNLGFYSIPQPVVLQQPSPVTADYNGPASFSVQAGGNSLTYQWQLNGTNIVGATNTTYTIANTSTNDVGVYTVGVSNLYGGVLSVGVPLTLVYTPVVQVPPQEQTITVGESATLTVTARGGRPLSYQWLLNSNAITGATGTNYTIANAQTNQSGYYQVLVSNVFSSVLSKPAKVVVFGGAITNDMVVHLNFDGSFNDASGRGNNATAVGTPTFQPGFLGQAVHLTTSGSPAGAPATNNYLTLGTPSDLNFSSDQDPAGAVDFSVSFWTKIFYQNDDQSFIGNKDWNSGSNPGWIIDTEGDGMKWNYRDNAVNVAGVGSTRRDSPHVAPQLEDGGWHHVLVTMARHSVGRIYVDGSLLSETALGTDSPTNIVGSIDTSGLGFSINIGQDGTGHYTDGGSASAVDMLMDDVAIWRRVLTDREALGIFNAGLNSNSVDQASIDSVGAAPIVQIQPKDASAGAGAQVSFNVGVLGTPSLGYQWYFGTNLLAGQNNTTYVVTNMQSSLGGNYSVVITNGYGSVTSRLAALTFTGVLPPTISTQPAASYVKAGATAAFSVTATGAGTLAYQWNKGGVAITTATNSTLTLSNVQTADQGLYTVTVSNAGGATNSANAVLKVFTGSLNSGLVAYLPFDSDYRDYSGRNNNGTAVGSPSFATGRVGQALHFAVTNDLSVNNYVTLGYPADLHFGTNDYSVGFWINCTNHGDDPAFISNKDWGSSGNQGWGVFSQGGGNFRVNANGTGGTKQNTTSTPHFDNGQWHFIVCSFWRGQYASIYMDGQFVLNSAATFGGSVDAAGKSVNIGQDGTGTYTDGNDASLHIDGFMDEVMLWNRYVTASEVASLYSAGTNNLTPLMFVTNAVCSANTVTFSWKGGVPPFTVSASTDLTGTNWTDTVTTTNQSVSIPTGGSAAFYRIRGVTP